MPIIIESKRFKTQKQNTMENEADTISIRKKIKKLSKIDETNHVFIYPEWLWKCIAHACFQSAPVLEDIMP